MFFKRSLLLTVCLCIILFQSACEDNTETGGSTSTAETTSTYSVGGTVSGLSGTVVLQNNTADDLTLTADGSFTFTAKLKDSSTYAVTVLTQPTGQTCTVSSGSGTINAANVTGVTVSCSTDSFTVGGTLSGLSGTVVLQNNAGNSLSLTSNGSFTFTTSVAHGSAYAVTVLTQPTGQTCTVSSGSGTINAANVTGVTVSCSTDSFTVGGTLSGLSGTVVLQNNGGNSLSLTSNGSFTFTTSIAHGSAYAVTVGTDPSDQNCTVTSGSGTINAAAVTSVSVSCADETWSMQAYLKAPNTTDSDQFGGSVAINGNTITVGSVLEDSNTTAIINGSDLSAANDSGSSNGALYVFTRSGTTWSHEAYLKAPNNSNSDQFGISVAVDSNTIAVGANLEDSNTTAIINGSDLSSTNDSGDRNGAVYVFTRSGTTWSHEAYLKAPNTTDIDLFGGSVAIDGDTIAVGASPEDSNTTAIINGSDLSSTNNSGVSNGAAYVFKRSGTTWSHEAYLKAPNTTNLDQFGASVAINGDTIAVGSKSEDSTTTDIINGSDLSSTNNSGSSNGAVYVFKRSGTTWSHEAYLKAPNTTNADDFGGSVSIDSDTIAVGVNPEDSNTTAIINGSDLSTANDSGASNGAVYVFKRSGTTWSHEAYLKAPNTSNSDFFGVSVALNTNTIAVSATGEDSNTTAIINGSDLSSTNDSGSENGAVYVFTRSGTTWSHKAYLKAPNTSNSDNFGISVAVDTDTIVVGADAEDSNTTTIINGSDLSAANDSGLNNGAVYVFFHD